MNSSLNPIVFALRHPITMMAAVAALVVGSFLAVQRMAMDVFPTLDLPVIYIAQPYTGLDPSQMESQITNYYEGYSIYISGIEHVESKNIQGLAVVKLFFHPGTNMAQAMAETVGYVNRAHANMPPGALPPYILRFDTGSVPIGYLALDCDGDRPIAELQDFALQRVRPVFASLPGVSSPPPAGGNARTIMVNVDPERLHAYHLSPDDVVTALTNGNLVLPSGNLRVQDQMPMVPSNAQVRDPKELGRIMVKPDPSHSIYLRDLATIEDTQDTPTGYALVNGKRTVFILVTKRADASTLTVVNALKGAMPRMQESLPQDVHLRYVFDQSPYVTRAMWGVGGEGLIGALLTGLMVLVFLRDWRSVLVVVLNIPLALMGALTALWVTGQTINIMTLGGLALAVGILVDEATVEVENIHAQMGHTESVAVAVRRGNSETAVPRLLAMLCILAVFVPMFFMEGAIRNMFTPLALAVSFSMITSYLLSSTFVPVVSVWLLRHHGRHGQETVPQQGGPRHGRETMPQQGHHGRHGRGTVPQQGGMHGQETVPQQGPTVVAWSPDRATSADPSVVARSPDRATPVVARSPDRATTGGRTFFDRVQEGYAWLLQRLLPWRWPLVGAYLGLSVLILVGVGSQVGTEIFPRVDTGQFQLRLKAATGTRIELTDEIAKQALKIVGDEAGPRNVDSTVGFVGTTTPNFAINSVYVWTSGPEEAVLRIALKPDSGVRLDDLRPRLRKELPEKLGAWLTGRLRKDGLTDEEIASRVAGLRLSFEPADIVNEVMSFGSPTPVEVVVYGTNLNDDRAYAAKVREEMGKIASLRDLQYGQAMDYPTVRVALDRERLGQSGVTVADVSKPLLEATSSSRVVIPNYWADLSGGIGYQVQVQVPPREMNSTAALGMTPIKETPDGPMLLRDVAKVQEGTMPGEYDRLNLRRLVSLTANIEGSDLGRVTAELNQALRRAGDPPRGVRVDVRGQVEPMRQMFNGLGLGLGLAVAAIFLLLTAYFQSPRLALAATAAVPAVLAGVAVALYVTHTTLNIQSFMGAIMAVGVAVANAILLLTFAERHRRADGMGAVAAAVEGARHRLRPILMTSCAMLAGMVPMALAFGEGGEQTAPLGRAVIGGLIAATLTTLLVLPAVFAAVQGRSRTASPSLDPGDRDSPHYHADALVVEQGSVPAIAHT